MGVVAGIEDDDNLTEFLMLDGGSDEHVARPDFGDEHPLEPSATRLRGVQKSRIAVDGQRAVPMLLGDQTECSGQ
eukprot:4309755-Alexandrium_andersonii.AAC.1